MTLPHDASLNGHRVDGVLAYLTASTGAAFAVVAIIFLIAVVFHSGQTRRPHHTHGDGRRARWLAALAGAAVLFGIDAVAVVRSAQHLRAGFWRYPDADPRAFRVEVTGRQWAWTFRTAGNDGRFNTADDIVTLNELHVPVNRPVTMQLTSRDVVHAMYLPNFRNKIDVIPGTVTRMWIEPREPGVFEIGCAQHCGAWHYKMRGELIVMDAGAFAAWSERATADAALRGEARKITAVAANNAAAAAAAGADAEAGWPWKPLP
ncbi:MAG: cytochrome C oxidase subunit II [Bacteroidota bacterium]